MSRHVVLLFACSTIVSMSAAAQQSGVTALPDSTVARVDRVFAPLGGAEAPGCAVGVSQAGRPVLTRAYGMANLEYGVPNTPETIFESGSVAKQFTATAMVLLAQDGKLSLDDDIRKWLPEVPDFGTKIAIRNLLTHTSGLRDQWGLLGLRGNPPGTQIHDFDTILDLVSHQKALNFDPGSEYLYSNTGYALAAIIVQRASGMPFPRFTRERMFGPLGMTNTRWRDDFRAIVKGRATAYSGTVASGFKQEMPFTNVIGNGGLLTTVGDLLKWNAFLDAPPAAVGGERLARTMQTPMVLTSGRPITYALGLDVRRRDGIREVTHGGATAGYRTWLARYPDNRVSVAVLCNVASANAGGFGARVAALFVPRPPAAIQTGSTMTLTSEQLAPYVGTFRDRSTQSLLRTVARDGALAIEIPGRAQLTAVAPNQFRFADGRKLVYRRTGAALRDVLFIDGADTTRYEPVTVVTPSVATLAEYAGSYWSDELDTRVTIAVKKGALELRRRPADVAVLQPVFADGFLSEDVGQVVFTRDARGRVNGLLVHAGRVRNVRFAREAR